MASLKEKAAEYEQKVGEQKAFLDRHRDGDGWKAFTPEAQKEFDDREKELAGIKAQVDNLRRIELAAAGIADAQKQLNQPADGFQHPDDGAGMPQINFGKAFTAGFKAVGKDKEFKVDISGPQLKTLMETSAGYAPEVVRNRPDLGYALRPITFLDYLFAPPINQPGVKYMEETTATNNAAETAEGGTYGEAALAFTEQSSLVRKIAVTIPVTDEQLEDVPYMEAWINNRLTYFLRARLETQTISGNGTAPNLRGLLNISGIQTQAKSTDPVFDAILKAATKIELNPFSYPTLGLIHPTDWQGIRLTTDNTGRYILGDPGMKDDKTIFGIPFLKTSAKAAGVAILMDTTTLELPVYRGVDIRVGMVNDDFVKGKQAIRADMRVAFFAYRPAAVCTITGL